MSASAPLTFGLHKYSDFCFFFSPSLSQKLQREVNSLSDDNRGVRKLALEKICKQVVTCKDSSQVILNGLLDVLLKPLLKVFSDPVEKCRDLAIGFFIE